MTGLTLQAVPDLSAARSTRGPRLHGRDVLWAGVVALLAMGVAIYFRSSLVPTDPWHYVQGAIAFPEGTWRPAGLSRWGFVLPIVPFARLWGDATATYYVMPLISTGVLAGVLFLHGTRCWSRTVGALGALFALVSPVVFVNLTRGYPDLMVTALVGLALLLAIQAQDAASDAQEAGRGWGWRVPMLLAACGFAAGWSFEVRETAVFGWPVIGWVLWRIGRPLRTLLWVIPPALGWLVLDLWLCASVYGDPWLKFRVLTGADISSSEVAIDAVYVGHSRAWYATIMPRSIWEQAGGPALFVCLVVGLLGGVVLRAQLGRVWAWGAVPLALLWLQGGVLDPAHPSVRLDIARYWLPFIVPLVLAAVGTVVITVSRSRGLRRVAVATAGSLLGVGVLVPAVHHATTYPSLVPNGGGALGELREYMAATGGIPHGRIWADWGTRRVLPTYQRGPFGDPLWDMGDVRSLNALLIAPTPSPVPRPGDHVVVWRALEEVEAAFGPFPADGWQLLFTSSAGNLRLYQLGPDATWPSQPHAGVAAASAPDSTQRPEDGIGDPGD